MRALALSVLAFSAFAVSGPTLTWRTGIFKLGLQSNVLYIVDMSPDALGSIQGS